MCLFMGACGGTQEGPAEDPTAQLGKQVYNAHCATCHQPTGQGLPGAFPTLHKTEWVTGDKGRLIRLTLNGVSGPMEVNGDIYNSVMTAHSFLNDDQLAAVLTYVRSNFGNDASAVTVEEVAAVRASLTTQEMWDPDVLKGMTGIPGQ